MQRGLCNFRTKRMINNRDFSSQIYKSRPGLISIFSHIPRSKISEEIMSYFYIFVNILKMNALRVKIHKLLLAISESKTILKTKSLPMNIKEVILKHEKIQWGEALLHVILRRQLSQTQKQQMLFHELPYEKTKMV